jgi:hypothetical protein
MVKARTSEADSQSPVVLVFGEIQSPLYLPLVAG